MKKQIAKIRTAKTEPMAILVLSIGVSKVLVAPPGMVGFCISHLLLPLCEYCVFFFDVDFDFDFDVDSTLWVRLLLKLAG